MSELTQKSQIQARAKTRPEFIVVDGAIDGLSSPEKEGSVLTLTDVSEPGGLAQIKDRLASSGGRCLVMVHPFYGLKRQEDMSKLLELAENEEYRKYIHEVVNLLKSFSKSGIPVVIIEDGVRGLQRKDNVRGLEATRLWLRKELLELADVDSGEIFYVVSEQGSPSPLISYTQEEKYQEMEKRGVRDFKNQPVKKVRQPIVDFAQKLKEVGLGKAYVCGSNVGGYKSFGPEYLSADSGISEGEFRGTVGVLREHFARRRRQSGSQKAIKQHPFETILPRGCLAELMRALAYCDIDVFPTVATFPQKTPAREQVESLDGDSYVIRPRSPGKKSL